MSTDFFNLAASALIDADNLANASERLLAAINTSTAAMERFEASGSEKDEIIFDDTMADVSECFCAVMIAVSRYRKQARKARAVLVP